MKTAKIRVRVLVPLVTALALLLAAFVVTVYRIQDNETTDRVVKKLNSVKELYKTQLDSDASMLAAALRVILSNERMKEALRAKDRKALLEWGASLSKELRVNHKITHFYFQGPDRVNILRFYKPEKYGDTINRFTMLEAQRAGQLIYGVELGTLGTFTLRVVSPCYDKGQLLGYIELGEEIEHIVSSLHKVLGVDIYVSIAKKNINREQWEEGMRMLGRKPDWERFPEHVIVSQTRKDFLEDLAPFLLESEHSRETMDITVSSKGAHYRCRFVHLLDASGKEVGDMIVALDVTDAIAAANRSSLVIAGVCVLVGGALFVLFYFFLGRVERQLVAAQQELEQWGETLEHKVQERTRELKEEIAERKRAEEALQKSEERFRQVSDSAGEWIWEVDAQGLYTYSSHVVEEILGYKPEEIVGKKYFYDFLAPDVKEEFKKAAFEGFAKKAAFRGFINPNVHKNGNIVILETNGTPVMDDKGNLLGYRGADTDITGRKKIEEALWESQERFRAIVENTVLGITIMDTNYKVIMTNATFAKLSGKFPDDFVGKYCFREFEKREAVCPHCPGMRAMASGKTEEAEICVVIDDGSCLYVRNRAIPLFGSDGAIKGFIEVVENVTERKQAEKEKEKLQVQLLQSEKMAAVGQLAGGVAHEINNPLSVILGFAQGVAKRINAGDPLEMPLKSIEREATRCKKIVQDLLTFSRSQKKEPEFIAVIPTIESALSLVQSRANTAAVEIIREFQENIPQLFANPTQVQQVVINLANNAMDAMEKGGTLTISAGRLEEDNKRWVEISVKDTGTGMSEEIQSHIFEPFFTTKEVGKGTGLGLGLCYEIVKSAGGTITFATEVGKGACFTVRLPAAAEGANAN
jgi:PAS domain S-box-containing protein